MTGAKEHIGRGNGLILAMLLLVYTFNFLDRQILGILAEPIKTELRLSDTQMGALGGIAFALLYSTMAIPLAIVADRTSRSMVITISLTVWSGFTALCGFAGSFWHLFAARVGVGIGEAGGVAPSYALVAAYFPPERRARALSVYQLGVPIGLAAGTLLGAFLAAAVSWRAAFIVVGVAGVLVAPVFRLIVKDPPREAVAPGEGATIGAVLRILAKKRSFWLMAFAASISSLSGYGLAFWIPSVLMRSFGFGLADASYFYASLLLLGGVSGVLAGGFLADRLGHSDRGIYVKLPTLAWLISAPLFVAGFLSPYPILTWCLFLLPNALNILWLGPLITAVQNLVPPHMRATASACFNLINNLIGLGLGALLMGALSTAMTAQYGADALRYAAAIGSCFYFIAALLGALAIRHLRRDWIE